MGRRGVKEGDVPFLCSRTKLLSVFTQRGLGLISFCQDLTFDNVGEAFFQSVIEYFNLYLNSL